ncbi:MULTISPECIES: RadC family protein [unclassified Gemella]|uniref:JAB domain-containing protein n=1 Tax=unclassified Gemella TaxID=2624949 RepID=UPI001D16F1E8|nr:MULTISPECIES: DNA repair protein RadC [unclassified Gemella]
MNCVKICLMLMLITCNNPKVVANYLRYKLQELKQEIFLVIDLDVKGKIIEEREVFRGSLDMSLIHPREIFKNSIKNSAASIICVHNHPSGDATPSLEDIKTTYKLLNVGNILGIEVLDHIVVARSGYCSLKQVLNILGDNNVSYENFSKNYFESIIKNHNLVKKY